MNSITERVIEKSKKKIPDFEKKYILKLIGGNEVKKIILVCVFDKNNNFSIRNENIFYLAMEEKNYKKIIEIIKNFSDELKKKIKLVVCLVFVNNEIFNLFKTNMPLNMRVFKNKIYFEILNESKNINIVVFNIVERKKIRFKNIDKNDKKKNFVDFLCSIVL